MREQRQPNYDVIDLPQDEPIMLVGQPGALRGEVRVHNPGIEKIVLRDAQVRSEPLRAVTAGMTTSATHVLAVMVLRPGQVRRLPLAVAASPYTPPGEYLGELEVAGHIRQVVLHVTEVVELDISPLQLVIENQRDKTFIKHVIFTNKGNVPLTIGEIGPVVLEDELMACRVLRGALKTVGDKVKGADEYLAEVIHQSKAAFDQIGLLRVHNTAGTVELQPGEVYPIDLEIHVPEKLENRTRYFGTAPLYTSNLNFVIVPTPSK